MVTASAELVTIAIVARNAAATIGRAVRSALAAGARRILLIDDHSDDDTAAHAREAGGTALSLVRPDVHRSVAHARQTALDVLTTPYGIWLDADDELLPGRIERMLGALRDGAELVFDPVLLTDGASGSILHTLPLPAFLARRGGLWRSFERNWIPMLAGGFDTAFARRIGFDSSFDNAEDYDFLLRSLVAGGRITLLDEPGYRYYHYSDSLSRDLTQARAHVRRAQQRFDDVDLGARLADAGLPPGERAFVLAARAMILGEHAALAHHCATLHGDHALIEPYARSTDWCGRFLLAASHLVCGEPGQALPLLEQLERESPPAEVRNNLGVACWLLGDTPRAQRLFAELRQTHPDYLDAARNWQQLSTNTVPTAARDTANGASITLHPLRSTPSRRHYAAERVTPGADRAPH